jgi:hypothetical protein
MPAPYDTLETVLNLARVRVNDAIASLGGQTLKDMSPFTLPLTNAAWRRLQDALRNFGFGRLKQETIFTAIPAVSGGADTGSQVSINWSTSPALPNDMTSPLKLWERVSGTNADYTPMDQALNGLPAIPKQSLNKLWEWREETIFIPGATSITDIRLRYLAYLADFTATSNPVPIVDCLSAFAWLIASEFSGPRGDVDVKYFDEMAAEGVEQIWNRDPAQSRSIFKPSEYGKMVGPTTPPDGPASRVPVGAK